MHQCYSCGRRYKQYVGLAAVLTFMAPQTAQVIKVGSGRVDEKTNEVVKPNVEVGSTVLYSKYSGTEFSDDDDSKSYIVVRESDIIAALA
jgi:chaperonin GroES